jgi:hypothetical protein
MDSAMQFKMLALAERAVVALEKIAEAQEPKPQSDIIHTLMSMLPSLVGMPVLNPETGRPQLVDEDGVPIEEDDDEEEEPRCGGTIGVTEKSSASSLACCPCSRGVCVCVCACRWTLDLRPALKMDFSARSGVSCSK